MFLFLEYSIYFENIQSIFRIISKLPCDSPEAVSHALVQAAVVAAETAAATSAAEVAVAALVWESAVEHGPAVCGDHCTCLFLVPDGLV